jgi:type IV pilus assembly protein PilA
MKKSRGFTLVELLAVIVILAVILVIAIPNIMKIIDKAKLDTYKRTEDMLVSATRSYLASNSISFTDNVPVTINYTTLRDNNYIAKIYDQVDKSECIYSKIYVTKVGNTYTYKTGLVCNNYISLDTFDLLKGIGSFNSDNSNVFPNVAGDNIADGWQWLAAPYACNANSITGNIQKYTGVLANQCIMVKPLIFNISPAPEIYYMGAYVKSNSANAYIAMGNGTSPNHDGSGIFKYLSVRKANNTNQTYARIGIQAAGDTNYIEVKNYIALNLTEIYGTGNESAQAEMDILVNKSR